MSFEVDIIKFLQSGLSTGWLSFFQTITLFGSWLGILIAFIIIFRKKKLMAIVMILTFGFSILLNFVIKNLVCRPRPFETYDFIVNYGGEMGYSMPSGHSVCVAVLAVFLLAFLFQTNKSKTVKALGTIFVFLFTFFVALSRMVLGVHYLTDVIIGLLEGTIISIVVLLIYNIYLSKLQKKLEKIKKIHEGDKNE